MHRFNEELLYYSLKKAYVERYLNKDYFFKNSNELVKNSHEVYHKNSPKSLE